MVIVKFIRIRFPSFRGAIRPQIQYTLMKNKKNGVSFTSQENDSVIYCDMRAFGSFNPCALSLPQFRNNRINYQYKEITELTTRANELKHENEVIEIRLKDLFNSPDANSFYRFKKRQIDFQLRLVQRDKEISEFAKQFGEFRTSTDISFMDTKVMQSKESHFDNISFNLLISNKQRPFFTREDIISLNEELRELIKSQEENIKLLRARLNLFESYHNHDSIRQTIKTLKRGLFPTPLHSATPTKAAELKTKRKLLSNQLQKLIEERKALLNPKLTAKMKRRNEKLRNASATKIQSCVRMYLAKLHIKKLHICATLIQKHWRGLSVRIKLR